ncbi:hypothetical protein GCM10010244_02200 [Streptomyces coeruleorubidus]|nr:hypothetical protein GCM10010244_02200 [Streptomyces bellus]
MHDRHARKEPRHEPSVTWKTGPAPSGSSITVGTWMVGTKLKQARRLNAQPVLPPAHPVRQADSRAVRLVRTSSSRSVS